MERPPAPYLLLLLGVACSSSCGSGASGVTTDATTIAVEDADAVRGGACEGTTCQAVMLDRMPGRGAGLGLLQQRGRATGASRPFPGRRFPTRPTPTSEPSDVDPGAQAKRLAAAKPLAWVHVPKSGSSIINFMVHLPGMCPGVPDGIVISPRTFGPSFIVEFNKSYDVYSPNGACPKAMIHTADHRGVGNDWASTYKGHAVIMMRQPEQRLISGYRFGYHSWPLAWPPSDALQYAKVVSGCVVRMLTRGGWGPEYSCGGRNSGPVTQADVDKAVHRLRHHFAFVGITEEWALSMCLGHRIFGGRCRKFDFLDIRLTKARTDNYTKAMDEALSALLPTVEHDISELHGWQDPWDGQLYDAAREIFQEDVLRYNVSAASCKPCFEDAGIEHKV